MLYLVSTSPVYFRLSPPVSLSLSPSPCSQRLTAQPLPPFDPLPETNETIKRQQQPFRADGGSRADEHALYGGAPVLSSDRSKTSSKSKILTLRSKGLQANKICEGGSFRGNSIYGLSGRFFFSPLFTLKGYVLIR